VIPGGGDLAARQNNLACRLTGKEEKRGVHRDFRNILKVSGSAMVAREGAAGPTDGL